jgi:hypothetical protein
LAFARAFLFAFRGHFLFVCDCDSEIIEGEMIVMAHQGNKIETREKE